MTITTERPTRKGFTLRDAGREFWKHPSPWVIGAVLASALTARVVVGDWQITDALVPVVDARTVPILRVGHPRVHPALAAEDSRQADHRSAARARTPPPSRRPARRSAIFIPWKALLWATPLAVGTALLAFPRLGLGLTFLVIHHVLGLGYEWTPLPDPQRLQAENPFLSGDLAKPPPTPLQERALLVHRNQLRHRRPGARHLPRSRFGRDLADSQEPARDRGLADSGRFGSPGTADGRNPVSQSENEHRRASRC